MDSKRSEWDRPATAESQQQQRDPPGATAEQQPHRAGDHDPKCTRTSRVLHQEPIALMIRVTTAPKRIMDPVYKRSARSGGGRFILQLCPLNALLAAAARGDFSLRSVSSANFKLTRVTSVGFQPTTKATSL